MSIKVKLSLIISLIILLSGTIISMVIYNLSLNIAKNFIGTNIESIVLSAQKTISPQSYLAIQNKINLKQDISKIIKSDEYKKIYQNLMDFKKNTALKYLYTMSKLDNGDIIYVVDAMPFDSSDFCYPGQIEKEEYIGLKYVFEHKKIYIGDISPSKKWGYLTLSATEVAHFYKCVMNVAQN